MAVAGLHWTTSPSEIATRVDRINDNITAVMEEIVQPAANDIDTALKTEAPWTDRSANARQGLTVQSMMTGQTIRIVAFHTMYYGIFLETKNGGAYAVILPVTSRMFPQVIQDVSDAFMDALS